MVTWPQVRQLCADMGEGLEVRNYERFAPLEVEPAGLRGGYRRVQPGDAVVAFSRATIFTIKKVRPLPPAALRSRRLHMRCLPAKRPACCSLDVLKRCACRWLARM